MSTKLVKVTFTRHAAPYMPGDVASFPEAHARDLHAKGVAFAEGPPAKAPERQTSEFDPATAPVEEVRAFIIGRGESIAESATEAELRKAAAALLKKSK